ncbi:MAG: 16S rRNA (guanine966-N2)-methyltransferase [Pseudohongiellaceae bacterium]|jgi:16S rRNA (guanine966-N2)-methyltransferase
MPRSHSPTITSGRFRGRRLEVPGGQITRPTRSLVRSALFDMMGPAIVGANVLDLYSGSGALGLEALSRGARKVSFVENHRRVLGVLKGNIASCGVEPEEMALVPMDATRWEPVGDDPIDVVQADPPFALVDALPPALERPGVLAEDAILIFHAPAERAIVDVGPGWVLDRTRHYGRSAVHLFYRED